MGGLDGRGLLDQAVVRVLRQKEELGLLDAAALGTFDDDGRDDEVDLDLLPSSGRLAVEVDGMVAGYVEPGQRDLPR